MYLSAEESSSTPGVMIVGFLLGGLLLYGVGYGMAVMRRANKDYKSTKAAVPVLRKGFWLAWWVTVKAAFWVVLAVACFVVWLVFRPDSKADAGQPTPAPTPSVSRSR